MKTPRIFHHIRKGQIFTLEEARDVLGTQGNTLRKRLSELTSRGYITHIRQGLYRLNPIGEQESRLVSSPFALASKVSPVNYLGYKSALYFLTGTPIPIGETICIVSPTKFNSFQFEGRFYIWLNNEENSHLYQSSIDDHGITYPVQSTDIERTIADNLKRPHHAPAFLDLIRLCQALPSPPQWEALLNYCEFLNTQTVFNRLGLLLEHLKKAWSVPAEVFAHLEGRMSRRPTGWPTPTSTVSSFSGNASFAVGHTSPSLGIPGVEGQERWKILFEPIPSSASKPSSRLILDLS